MTVAELFRASGACSKVCVCSWDSTVMSKVAIHLTSLTMAFYSSSTLAFKMHLSYGKMLGKISRFTELIQKTEDCHLWRFNWKMEVWLVTNMGMSVVKTVLLPATKRPWRHFCFTFKPMFCHTGNDSAVNSQLFFFYSVCRPLKILTFNYDQNNIIFFLLMSAVLLWEPPKHRPFLCFKREITSRTQRWKHWWFQFDIYSLQSNIPFIRYCMKSDISCL